jgi:choline kinase/phosphatidylglycerophosphate synthase
MSQTSLGPSSRVAGSGEDVPGVGVVLAAGRSERLSSITGGRPKALVSLGGMTLVERAVRTLFRCGLERVIVVVGYQGDAVATALDELFPDGNVEVVFADGWEAGNGASMAAAERASGGGLFALLCGDHTFADGALDELVLSGVPAVLVEESPEGDVWAEGTRVRVRDGRAIAFGKALDEPAVDCGAFLLGPEVFEGHRLAAAAGDHSLAGAVTRMAGVRPIHVSPMPAEAWWQDVDTPADLRSARVRLRRSLTKEGDGPVSRYLNRQISTRMTMALAPFRISPDVLSVATFVLGLMAAWALARGHGLLGGGLAQASSVVDGVDGETARLHGRVSGRGARLDNVLDRMVDAAVFAGLGLWAINDKSHGWAFLVLAAASLGWAFVATAARPRFTEIELPPSAERRLGFLLGGRDGRMLLLAASAVIGVPVAGLAAAGTTYLSTVAVRTVLVRRRRRTAGAGRMGEGDRRGVGSKTVPFPYSG